MISVKVCYQDSGKPAKGVRACIGFSGFFSGMSSEEYTDSNGEAHFDNDPGSGKVYVNGKDVHNGHLSGRVVVYI
jgi:hypothetical protein